MSDSEIRDLLRQFFSRTGNPGVILIKLGALITRAGGWRPGMGVPARIAFQAMARYARFQVMATARAAEALRLARAARFLSAVSRLRSIYLATLPPAAFLLFIVGIGLLTYMRSASAGDAKQVSQRIPYCDCTHVTAGLLTKEYQNQCRGSEAALFVLTGGSQDIDVVRKKLSLQSRENGRLASGQFCDSVVAGPDAWPVAEGPVSPPPRQPEAKPCMKVTGLTRDCVEGE